MTTGPPLSIILTALQWVSGAGSSFSEAMLTLSQQTGISTSSAPVFFITDHPPTQCLRGGNGSQRSVGPSTETTDSSLLSCALKPFLQMRAGDTPVPWHST